MMTRFRAVMDMVDSITVVKTLWRRDRSENFLVIMDHIVPLHPVKFRKFPGFSVAEVSEDGITEIYVLPHFLDSHFAMVGRDLDGEMMVMSEDQEEAVVPAARPAPVLYLN